MHLYAWENKDNYFHLEEIKSFFKYDLLSCLHFDGIPLMFHTYFIYTEPVLVNMIGLTESPPNPISQILSTTHYSLTRLHSLLSIITVIELGNFRISKEWLYIHNSVLPHSSQYIGDYITIWWILIIETTSTLSPTQMKQIHKLPTI